MPKGITAKSASRRPASGSKTRRNIMKPKGWPKWLLRLKKAQSELPNNDQSRYIKVIKPSTAVERLQKGKEKMLMRETVAKVNALPVYLISAHSCLCRRRGKCFGGDFEKTFDLPKDTFVISFAQGAEFSCVNENIVAENWETIRRMLYLHSEAEVTRGPYSYMTNDSHSLFSGVRRAVGPFDEFPNINYTFNEFQETKQGKKLHRLVARNKNPYGVYRLDTWLDTYGQYYNMDDREVVNNTRSIISQDIKHTDMLLKDVIQMVYEKEGIDSALFISGGCLTLCPPEVKPANGHAKAKAIANAEQEEDEDYYSTRLGQSTESYKSILTTLTQKNIEEMPNVLGVPNINARTQQAVPTPKNLKRGLELGLYSREGAIDLAHTEDKEEIRKHADALGLP